MHAISVSRLLLPQLLLLLLVLSAHSFAVGSSTVPPFEHTVVFLHRHGARSPQGVVTVDGVQMANCAYPLCQLTDAGKAMCFSLGKYLRKHFLDVYTPDAVRGGYDVKNYTTESTDTKRTVQSAESVLAGIFDADKTTAPFVNFVPTSMDYNMSFWSSWPYWRMGQVRETRLYTVPGDYIRKELGQDLVDQFGVVMGAQELCKRSPVDCLVLVADILECNASNAQPLADVFVKNADKIRNVKAVMFAKLLGYDPADHASSVDPGGFGYALGVELLESLQYDSRTMSNTSGAWPFRVWHYSAHDWTLFPLYSALGLWTPEMMLDLHWIPKFADTLVLVTTDMGVETVAAGTQQQRRKLGVKAYRVYPQQLPTDPGNVLSAASFPVAGHEEVGLLCTPASPSSLSSAKPSFSNESAMGCSIDAVLRTVQRVAPRSPLGGMCYATEKHLSDAGCLSDGAPADGSACHAYRAVCNQMPCGVAATPGVNFLAPDGFSKLADPERGYACTETRPTQEEYPTAIAATLVSVGFVVGTAVGGVLMWVLYGRVQHLFTDSAGTVAKGTTAATAQSAVANNKNDGTRTPEAQTIGN